MNRLPLLIPVLTAVAILFAGSGCDHGLEPPAPLVPGTISGSVTYEGTWPPSNEVVDLRFVAMRFVPRDTSDFLQLNLMAISDRLRYGVVSDTFTIGDVDPGPFVYAGIAQQFEGNLLAWRPVGLFRDGGGIFDVRPNDTTHVAVHVDFSDLPPFPPPGN